MTPTKPTYLCKYCHKSFVREQAFIDHECKRMKREKELQTLTGQAALQYYQTWLRQKKRIPPSANAFVDSKYFRTFMNFATFSKKVKLPFIDKFIWLMVLKDYPPVMWMNDVIYTQYLDFVDSQIDPIELVNGSITTLLEYTNNRGIDVSKFFSTIDNNELIHLIRLRKISPWILLFSVSFSHKFANMSAEQQAIIENLIDPDSWDEKIEKNASTINLIKLYVDELGI